MAEGVQELESSSHLVGGHEVLVVQVRLAEEEPDDGDLGSVKVVGDAKHVVLLLRWRLGLGLHEGHDVLPLTWAVVVVDAALPEHLEGWPSSDRVLKKKKAIKNLTSRSCNITELLY